MKLLLALEIGTDCALHTVGEAIYNVDLRAGQIFDYGSINKELQELYDEYAFFKKEFGICIDTPIEECMSYITEDN